MNVNIMNHALKATTLNERYVLIEHYSRVKVYDMEISRRKKTCFTNLLVTKRKMPYWLHTMSKNINTRHLYE